MKGREGRAEVERLSIPTLDLQECPWWHPGFLPHLFCEGRCCWGSFAAPRGLSGALHGTGVQEGGIKEEAGELGISF